MGIRTFVTKSSPTFRRPITNRIWRYRKIRQLSQKDVARLLGHRNTAHVSRWENGVKTPTLDNALVLACIFKAPVEALFPERVAELQVQINRRVAKLASTASHPDHANTKEKTTG